MVYFIEKSVDNLFEGKNLKQPENYFIFSINFVIPEYSGTNPQIIYIISSFNNMELIMSKSKFLVGKYTLFTKALMGNSVFA